MGFISRHGGSSRQVDLTLDLLPRPTSSVDSPRPICRGVPDLAHKGRDPVIAEVSSELAIREGIRHITKKLAVVS